MRTLADAIKRNTYNMKMFYNKNIQAFFDFFNNTRTMGKFRKFVNPYEEIFFTWAKINKKNVR